MILRSSIQGLIPAKRGIVVVCARVGNAISIEVMRQVSIVGLAAESKLHYSHAR